MTKSESKKQWPNSLSKKDCSLIICFRFEKKIEKYYSCGMQVFCKSLNFKSIRYNQPENLNWASLESIINQAKEISLIIMSLLFNMRISTTTSITLFIFQVALMKLVTILVILCKLAYQNNSNYLPLFVVIYLYFAGI